MYDLAEIEGGGFGNPREIGFLKQEGVGHSHRREGVFEIGFKPGLELRHFGLKRNVFGARQDLRDPLAREGGDVVGKRGPFRREQRGEGVAPAHVGLDEPDRTVAVGQVTIFTARKEGHGRVGPVLFVKEPGRFLGLERVGCRPFSVEEQGVDEQREIVAPQVVEDLIDQPVGMILHPLIDVLDRRFVKRGAEGARAIDVGVDLQKVLFDRETRVVAEPDRVGDGKRDAVVLFQRREVSRKEGVEFPDRQPEGAFHLRPRLSRRAVCGHGEGDESRERGEQGVFAVVGRPEEPRGKVHGESRGVVRDGRGFALTGRDPRHQVGGDDLVSAAGEGRNKDEEQ